LEGKKKNSRIKSKRLSRVFIKNLLRNIARKYKDERGGTRALFERKEAREKALPTQRKEQLLREGILSEERRGAWRDKKRKDGAGRQKD